MYKVQMFSKIVILFAIEPPGTRLCSTALYAPFYSIIPCTIKMISFFPLYLTLFMSVHPYVQFWLDSKIQPFCQLSHVECLEILYSAFSLTMQFYTI